MAIKINKDIQISDSTTTLEQLSKITNIDKQLQDTNSHRVNGFNGRLSSLDFSKTASEYATTREDLLTASVTNMSDKPGDGYVKTFYWDNSGTWDTQIYIPNNPLGTSALRAKNGTSTWGKWQPISRGTLLAVGNAYATSGTSIPNSTKKAWSDSAVGSKSSKVYNTFNGGDILTYTSGAFYIKTYGIVKVVKCTINLSGYFGSGNKGVWFNANSNTLPTGVTMYPYNSLMIAPDNNYGGIQQTYLYMVESTDNLQFFVNPTFNPYGGSMRLGIDGCVSSMNIEVYG